jgi:GTP-binding protein
MKIVSAEFVRSCERPDQLPHERLPEVAFAGRSNVGKSSLINSLLHRRGLAKVSGTPGKTRLINYFRITTEDPQLRAFYLVDLPGYGYAKASKSIRAAWGPMIQRYLTQRVELLGVILLVDARGLEAQDLSTAAWLREIGRPPIVVTTKVDKLSRNERGASEQGIRDSLQLSPADDLVMYSSTTHEGREALWGVIRHKLTHKV